jgi:hypothetical protein
MRTSIEYGGILRIEVSAPELDKEATESIAGRIEIVELRENGPGYRRTRAFLSTQSQLDETTLVLIMSNAS